MAQRLFLNSRPRVDQRLGLENRYGSLAHREFKSLPLRSTRSLSFSAPAGLNGGPLFVPGSDRVFGMVVGNLERCTTLVEESKVVTDGHTHSVEGRQIMSYAMALSLWHVEEWLKVVTPLSGHAV